jgi:hypothetical protein
VPHPFGSIERVGLRSSARPPQNPFIFSSQTEELCIAIEDGSAGRAFDVVGGGDGQQQRGGVGDPRVVGGDVQTLGQVILADEVDEVEVKQEECVAGAAKQLDRLPGEGRGEEVLPAEADDQRGEERDEQAAVHQDIRHVDDCPGEEWSPSGWPGACRA